MCMIVETRLCPSSYMILTGTHKIILPSRPLKYRALYDMPFCIYLGKVFNGSPERVNTLSTSGVQQNHLASNYFQARKKKKTVERLGRK